MYNTMIYMCIWALFNMGVLVFVVDTGPRTKGAPTCEHVRQVSLVPPRPFFTMLGFRTAPAMMGGHALRGMQAAGCRFE